MKNKFIVCLFSIGFLLANTVSAQRIIKFEDAEKFGIGNKRLDSIYKSAIHADANLAVFKTAAEQQNLRLAYNKFIQNLGNFLKENNFKWDNPTRCFNRIYMNADGTVEYFLYHFTANNVPDQQEKQFNKLLNLFVKDHKFGITANERFAQCSPIVYTSN